MLWTIFLEAELFHDVNWLLMGFMFPVKKVFVGEKLSFQNILEGFFLDWLTFSDLLEYKIIL